MKKLSFSAIKIKSFIFIIFLIYSLSLKSLISLSFIILIMVYFSELPIIIVKNMFKNILFFSTIIFCISYRLISSIYRVYQVEYPHLIDNIYIYALEPAIAYFCLNLLIRFFFELNSKEEIILNYINIPFLCVDIKILRWMIIMSMQIWSYICNIINNLLIAYHIRENILQKPDLAYYVEFCFLAIESFIYQSIDLCFQISINLYAKGIQKTPRSYEYIDYLLINKSK